MTLSLRYCFLLFLLVSLQFQDHASLACLEEEMAALLEIRAVFYPDGISAPQSWETTDDCCEWEKVVCDAKTGHVRKLLLNSTWDGYTMGDLYLNASLFAPFQELGFLNLSSNSVMGFVSNDGFEELSVANKLEFLDLSENSFNDTILASLGGLSSLRSLSLAMNLMEGSTHFQELAALSNLEELDLSTISAELDSFISIPGLRNMSKLQVLKLNSNKFNSSTLRSLGALPSLQQLFLSGNNLNGSFVAEDLGNLRSLEVLDLSSSNLSSSFLQVVELMTSLRALSLRGNKLNASLEVLGLCKLRNLEELDLSENNFEGTILPCFGDLTSLRVLDLSRNRLSGNISSSFLSSFTSLEFLSLSHNVFERLAPLSALANHSKLQVFELVSGTHALAVEADNPGWIALFQLKVFRLSNCTVSRIPYLLSSQNDLRVVDLSHNRLAGELPIWLMENNTRLSELHLKNNSFSGRFLVPQDPNAFLSLVDVSDNQLRGIIPDNIAVFLPNLKLLNLSDNSFTGGIPSSFGDMRELNVLDMSKNFFTGEVPQHLALMCFSLAVLKLSSNSFIGRILPRFSNLTSLQYLLLDGNQFHGEIPDSLSNSSELKRLDVSQNLISGNLPGWIGDMAYLEALVLSGNQLRGSIPKEFCSIDALSVLDLAQNNLSGLIPPCFSPSMLQHVNLQENGFVGHLEGFFSKSSRLLSMDIRYNNFTGSIPKWISELSSLSILLLRGNNLSGKIPTALCQLSMMTILDLSLNNLSGSIPSCLSRIPFRIGFRSGKFTSSSSYPWSPSYTYKRHYTELPEDSEEPVQNYLLKYDTFSVEFTTKRRPDFYRGRILYLMTGIDLSSNELTGNVPPEIGNLSRVHALNLSHNGFTGPIPTAFSSLKVIESLDLSFNNLTGPIPAELTRINTLAVFSVAYNNLSGSIPDRAQFGTFSESSYAGNPLLCGHAVNRSCGCAASSSINDTCGRSREAEASDSLIDMAVFWISFAVSCGAALIVLALTLSVNQDWRRRWFLRVDYCASRFVVKD